MAKDVKGAPAQDTAAQPQQFQPATEDSKIFGAISYVFGFLIAIIIYLLKKEDRYVRFHAAQAILFDICIMVASVVLAVAMIGIFFVVGIATGGIGFILFPILWVGMIGYAFILFIARLYFAYRAYKGNAFQLPIVGPQAAKMAAG
jgi:uncharacterized membrane protein